MKTIMVFASMLIGLICPVVLAQPGLKGEYYNGINFEKKVGTRIDPQISFNWRDRSPAPGMGQSYFSVRWTGKLLAPASGRYVFSATVDDGVRIWVDNKKIVDEWALHDDIGVRGEIVLEAGKYYDLRVDYFNEKLEGLISLFWQRPDEPVLNSNPNASSILNAQYLSQTAPPISKPVAVPPKPKPVVVAVVPTPKPVSKPVLIPAATSKPAAATAVTPVSVTSVTPEKKAVGATFGTLETGKSLVLENVFFEQSSYVLLPASFAELDKLVLTLRQNPVVRIEIAGHTDNVGDARLNQSLSEYRARVVKNYLNQHGIAEARVEAKGYGGSRPLNGNNTEHERARNRRVEFLVK